MALRGLALPAFFQTARLAAGLTAVLSAGTGADAHPHPGDESASHAHEAAQVHENGIGPDPDGDANPATDTGGLSVSGAAAALDDGAPYAVIDFEAPPGAHGDPLSAQYKDEFGVSFGPGLTRQICEGQRRFAYDTLCAYEAAPSGAYAAGYANDLNAPFEISFDRPVCVVAMAIYPTGGKEGEPFRLTIRAWDEDGASLPPVAVEFEWTQDTVRWRHMAGAYYLDRRASKLSLRMESLDARERRDILRFLIDDVAIIETGCGEALQDMQGGAAPAPAS